MAHFVVVYTDIVCFVFCVLSVLCFCDIVCFLCFCAMWWIKIQAFIIIIQTMKGLILSIYILLSLVESSSHSQENPLAEIVGIWKGEKFSKKSGRTETSQYSNLNCKKLKRKFISWEAVVKVADTYKAVWWPKDPADRRVGIVILFHK